MNLDELVSNIRRAACLVLVAALCFGAGCRNRDNVVVVRILLPPLLPTSSTALRKAVMNLGHFPVEMDTGLRILPATMEPRDDDQYRMFLQDIQTYRPQIVVVSTKNDIPALLRGENTYATLPCTALSSACVSVLTPWGTDEERRAAGLVIRHLGPDTRTGNHSGEAAQH
jgi:hypothetical protein